MSHMSNFAGKYNARAELRKVIVYFEKSIRVWEKDSTYPFPTINGAIADGVTPAAKGTIHLWRRKHPDLDQQIADLIARGPHADSGKCQTVPPPGVSPAQVAKKLTMEQHRDETINALTTAGLTAKLEEFIEGADPRNIEDVKELNRTLGHLTKGWPKDVRGELSLDHKHSHVHRLVSDLVEMTPEQRAQAEDEAIREINKLEDQERRVKAIQPGRIAVGVGGVIDADRIN